MRIRALDPSDLRFGRSWFREGVKTFGFLNYPVAAAQPAQSARAGRAGITAPLLSSASTSDPSSTLFVAVSRVRTTNTHTNQNGILLDIGRVFRHAVQVGLGPRFSMCQCNHGIRPEASGQLWPCPKTGQLAVGPARKGVTAKPQQYDGHFLVHSSLDPALRSITNMSTSGRLQIECLPYTTHVTTLPHVQARPPDAEVRQERENH